MPKFIQIKPEDNVAVAVAPLAKGTKVKVNGQEIELLEDIKQAHKFAIEPIKTGNDVMKYGSSIGQATEAIAVGEWVHTHNVKTNLDGTLEYNYDPQPIAERELPKPNKNTFMGYLRDDGQVGIRNEIWVLPTVSCTNQTATIMIKTALAEIKNKPWANNIDGIFEYKHPYGCSQLGDDHKNTQKLLASLAKHPNAAGVLIVGLGCENNQVSEMKEVLGDYDPDRIKFLVTQEVEDEIQAGAQLLVELAERASTAQRQELPLSHLKIGLKCGGSDGMSGVTANPLVGVISDMIVAEGGISVLTEVPEMFGAEHLLMNRAKDEQVYEDIVKLINDFKEYFLSHNQPVYENPSPGNKEGGITTLEDKSLGCTEKGGTSQVVAVRDYAEQVTTPGLNLLCSPGNDLIAATTLAAAGCQLVLFTTGRGTPFGTCVPTIKIATNSQLFNHKQHWMDFNAGTLAEGRTFDQVAVELLDEIADVASGKETKAELMEFREIAIWKGGVTL